MPGARWFEGATLNYTEAVFARATTAHPALLAGSEREPLREISWDELRGQVAAAASGLRRLGVGRGDRVAAIVAQHARSRHRAARDRQSRGDLVELRARVRGAQHHRPPGADRADRPDRGRWLRPRRARVRSTRRGRRRPGRVADPSGDGADPGLDGAAGSDDARRIAWPELLAGPSEPLTFEPVPFDHPLWILFSSGTTGLPKAIVHGHGGVVLEHVKAVGLHLDVRPGDRLLWYTTTGWMMWNFLVGSLLVGGTAVLYDGSPGHPDLDVLWGIAERARSTHLGASAGFLMACRKAGLRPGRAHDLTTLRCIGSTGSPLPVDGFRWVYDAVGRDVRLDSLSGGTDVVSAFVGGSPLLPVRAGELSCRYLGARVEAFDEDGRSIRGQTGELVITAPMPSMPIGFWNDPDGTRYRDSYFTMYPGVWRHGDWIRLTASGGAVIEGRSDSTLNRGGVRFGTSELYGVVDAMPEIVDSLVIGIEHDDGTYWMPLFVVLRDGVALDDVLTGRIRTAIRSELSPRHLPDEIIAVPAIPRTLSGKKMEIPVKRLLQGHALETVAAAGTTTDPAALAWFAAFVKEHAPHGGRNE